MTLYPKLPATDPTTLTRKDFQTDQDVRWCPGCGDYAILAQVHKTLPELGIPRENFVFISGIGCSSRFPYYTNTFGMHSIHGRAPTIATGVKTLRPDLSVWVVTGDGDALSIGGNHLIHALRRNVDLKILMFNNRIYGLTKGQYSPTSEQGKKTKSTPMGSVDYPFNPISLALSAEATFVARSVDVDAKHLGSVLERAARHKGSAFVEIYQNCNIFNDGAFEYLTDRTTKADHELKLEHGKPVRFGAQGEKGIALDPRMQPVVVDVAEYGEDRLLVHDETNDAMAYFLSRLVHPNFPTPVGVFRAVERPTYDGLVAEQIAAAKSRAKPGGVQALLEAGETWVV
ncbi:MAG: 2-oxoacid:ferredoxin oxidoreductase subunit beta [Bradymonadia bacterium]